MAREEGKANTQSRRFIETARELGCDENPKAFERAVRRVVKHKGSSKEERAADEAHQKQRKRR